MRTAFIGIGLPGSGKTTALKELAVQSGAVYIAPYHVCRERNQGRKRVVPDFEMGVMAGWLAACPPAKAEGFDRLVEFNTFEQ